MINIFPYLHITLLCYMYIYIVKVCQNLTIENIGTKIMSSSISLLFLVLGLHLISALAVLPGEANGVLKIHTLSETTSAFEDCLSFSYYQQKCPDAEAIINRKLKEWFQKDYTLAASLIRLHFHDCAVRVRTISLYIGIAIQTSLFYAQFV